MIHFITIEVCFEEIFPAIRRHLASKNNPAPQYEDEFDGLAYLESRLDMTKNDSYYKNFFGKAAYLFVAVVEGHFFSNGNKRLALSLLAKFYEINKFRGRKFSRDKFSKKLGVLFPKYKLKKTVGIKTVFPEMIYHLAKIVANKDARGDVSFDELKERVEEFLRFSLVRE